MIVEGFFADVYDRITLEPVRDTLRTAVASRLGDTATSSPNQ
jgi:Fe-S cluster assembly protein SufD